MLKTCKNLKRKEILMFTTKGEFIQALKDYNEVKTKLENLKSEYKNTEYLRFSKVKSSLDYDVAGYENGEQMRVLKGRSYSSPEQVVQRNESLDKKLSKLEKSICDCESRLNQVDEFLLNFKEPSKSIVIRKYRDSLTYNDLANRFTSVFPVGYPNAVKRYIDCELEKAFRKAQ